MLNKNYNTCELEKQEKNFAKDFSKEEIFVIGCKANAGESITGLSKEYKINREFIYNQKNKIKELIFKELTKEESTLGILAIDDNVIKKIIVALMMICTASTENTQRFIEHILGIHVSIGKISNIINEACDKAKEFNDTVNLNNITVGANDEIFQCNTPILVGVDLKSTYTYLLELAQNRDSTTWGCAFLDKEQQGLHLEISVNDGGTGLVKGVKEAFEDVKIQYDVFHAEKDISMARTSLERSAYKDINQEEKLESKLAKKKNIKESEWEEYENIAEKTKKSIDLYDNLNTLYCWLIEIFLIGGYLYNEKMELLHFIIDEIEKLGISNSKLIAGIKFLKNHDEELFTFIKTAENQLYKLSETEHIDIEILTKMWAQKMHDTYSEQYNNLEIDIGEHLGKRYNDIRAKFKEAIKNVYRASSMVECVNSLIRPYLFLKKVIPKKFLSLVQFYLNTRKYRRSRVEEREGKSPLELLTGEKYDNPLELLGY